MIVKIKRRRSVTKWDWHRIWLPLAYVRLDQDRAPSLVLFQMLETRRSYRQQRRLWRIAS